MTPAPTSTYTTTTTTETTTTVPETTTTASTTTTTLAPLQSIGLDLITDQMSQPTALSAPKGDDRLFVAEREGRIRLIHPDHNLADSPFLDITEGVTSTGIEQGLLGLAFHPEYEDNGRFFVYFVDEGGRRQLSEFGVSADDPDRADPGTERVLFELDQPPNSGDIRHYGGNLAFGPDGYLWISLGDGVDARGQGQNPDTMWATISRIDVDGGDPYRIPADNPFADDGGAPEVWAYGLRNPWRFDIDPDTRLVYVADVGLTEQEEINVVPISPGGYNFGWSDMEGNLCRHEPACDPEDYTAPVLTYGHDEGLSVTGGYVYRGREIPELAGTYFYADWVLGWIRSFVYEEGEVTEETDWTGRFGGPVGQINSFGLDGHDELYVLTFDGGVYRLTASR